MDDSYVTSGAKIKCSCGDKTSTLTVYPDRTGFLTDKPVANVSDHTSMYNIAPFGKCHTTSYPPTGSATAANHGSLTPMPCVPGTKTKWQNGKNDYIIKGDAALLKSSYCKCCYGGIITIVDDGQVHTGEADLSRKTAETEDEWKEKEQEELLADKDGLLDGLQTVLDVAGFAPGVGAIADLTNAAIYAVRGDKINAGLSLLAAVPGIGDAAAAAKLAGKGVKVARATKVAKNAKTVQKTTSNTKFGELTQKKSVNTSTTSQATSTPKFGEITGKSHQPTPQSQGSNSSQHKFGELTRSGHTTQSPSIKTSSEPSHNLGKGTYSKPVTKHTASQTQMTPTKVEVQKTNDGPLKDVFKYKGTQPKPENAGKKLDLSS